MEIVYVDMEVIKVCLFKPEVKQPVKRFNVLFV